MKKNGGFTLIEVLIALMILALSLTAIVKATSSDISNTAYLKEKALANLVAIEARQLIQLRAIAFNNNKTEQKTMLANNTWFWQATKTPTEIKNMVQIDISVSHNHQSIVSTTGYLLEYTD